MAKKGMARPDWTSSIPKTSNPLSRKFRAKPKAARKRQTPSSPAPWAQRKRSITRNPSLRPILPSIQTRPGTIWKMTFLWQTCKTCNKSKSPHRARCGLQTVEKEVSFRASAHAGVGIPPFFEFFQSKINFFPYLGDCHTSDRFLTRSSPHRARCGLQI